MGEPRARAERDRRGDGIDVADGEFRVILRGDGLAKRHAFHAERPRFHGDGGLATERQRDKPEGTSFVHRDRDGAVVGVHGTIAELETCRTAEPARALEEHAIFPAKRLRRPIRLIDDALPPRALAAQEEPIRTTGRHSRSIIAGGQRAPERAARHDRAAVGRAERRGVRDLVAAFADEDVAREGGHFLAGHERARAGLHERLRAERRHLVGRERLLLAFGHVDHSAVEELLGGPRLAPFRHGARREPGGAAPGVEHLVHALEEARLARGRVAGRHEVAHERAGGVHDLERHEPARREVAEILLRKLRGEQREAAAGREVAVGHRRRGGAVERDRARGVVGHDHVVDARGKRAVGGVDVGGGVAVDAQTRGFHREGGHRARLGGGAARAPERVRGVGDGVREAHLHLESVGRRRHVARVDPLRARGFHVVELLERRLRTRARTRHEAKANQSVHVRSLRL